MGRLSRYLWTHLVIIVSTFVLQISVRAQEDGTFYGAERTVIVKKIKRVKGESGIYLIQFIDLPRGSVRVWGCSVTKHCSVGERIRRNREYTLTVGHYAYNGVYDYAPGSAWMGTYLTERDLYIQHPEPQFSKRRSGIRYFLFKKSLPRSYPILFRIDNTTGQYMCVPDSL